MELTQNGERLTRQHEMHRQPGLGAVATGARATCQLRKALAAFRCDGIFGHED